jgi:hypothetical protein
MKISITAPYAVDDHGVVVQTGARIAKKVVPRIVRRDSSVRRLHLMMRLDPVQKLLVPFSELRIQHRAHQYVLSGVADFGAGNRGVELRHELIMD